MRPQDAVALTAESERRRAGKPVREVLVEVRVLAALHLLEPPRLAPHRHEQPAHHGLRVLDALGTLDEPQPSGLHDVLGEPVRRALGSGGVPQHRGEEVDELVHRADVARAVLPEGVGCSGRERLDRTVGAHHGTFGPKRAE